MGDRREGTWGTLYGSMNGHPSPEGRHALENAHHVRSTYRLRRPRPLSRHHRRRGLPPVRHQPQDRLQVAPPAPPPPAPAPAPAAALDDRSRRPLSSPGRTADDVEARILAARDQYGWGGRKLRAL